MLISLAMACFVPSGGARVGHRLRAGRGRYLQGTAFYRERIALPRTRFSKRCCRHLACRAAGEVLGRARLEPAGQSPFHFSISYDDAAIQPGRRYAVRAPSPIRGAFCLPAIGAIPSSMAAMDRLRFCSCRRAVPEGQWSSCRRTNGRSLFRGRSAAADDARR